jgi:hypothetical protein
MADHSAPCMCPQSISLACQLQRAIERAERSEKALAEAKQELLRLATPGSVGEPQPGSAAVRAVKDPSDLVAVGVGSAEHVATGTTASSVPSVAIRDDGYSSAEFAARHAVVTTAAQCGDDSGDHDVTARGAKELGGVA